MNKKTDKSADKLFVVERENSSNIDEGQPRDMVRHLNNSYWTNLDPGSQSAGRNDLYKNSHRSLFKSNFSSETPDGITEIVMTKHRFSNKRAFDKSKAKLMEFLSHHSTTPFTDHAAEFNVYESSSNERENAIGVLNLYATIKPSYNFLSERYEDLLAEQEGIPDHTLPSIYNFLLNQDPSTAEIQTILSQNGKIKVPSQPSSPEGQQFAPIDSYYQQWALNWRDWRNSGAYNRTKERMRSIFFTKDDMSRLNDVAKYKELFPMFVEIEFNAEFESGLGTTLSETKYTESIKSYMEFEPHASTINTYEASKLINDEELAEGNDVAALDNSSIALEARNFYDISDLFENSPNLNSRIGSSHYFSDNVRQPFSDYKAYYTMMAIIAKAKTEAIIKNNQRTFEEIFNGKLCHSETVMYIVRKYNSSEELIQTYHFANIEGMDKIKFIDTQVKYEKEYRYDISAVKIVLGAEYTYERISENRLRQGTTNLPTEPPSDEDIRIRVRNKPSTKLIEIPLMSKEVKIMDSPPLPPAFLPIPLKGINNRMRFFLNSAPGRAFLKPLPLTELESARIDFIKSAKDNSNEEVYFETDDTVDTFFIYRLESPPSSYKDFITGGKEMKIKTALGGTSSSSGAIEDKLIPNKRYYYMARCRDIHENYSNPTEVYEIELVDDAGSTYPVIRQYEFKTVENRTPVKPARRFIHISPTTFQSTVNMEMSKIAPDKSPMINQRLVLGNEKKSLWGKKFKIRLTSKSTGKKVDFNFTFSYEPKMQTEI